MANALGLQQTACFMGGGEKERRRKRERIVKNFKGLISMEGPSVRNHIIVLTMCKGFLALGTL